MPELIRHPEKTESTGFRVKPGMTLCKLRIYVKSSSFIRVTDEFRVLGSLGIFSGVGLDTAELVAGCADQTQREATNRIRRAQRPALLWTYRTTLTPETWHLKPVWLKEKIDMLNPNYINYLSETTLDKNTACDVLSDYVQVGELKPLNSTIKKGGNNEKIINIGNDHYFYSSVIVCQNYFASLTFACIAS